jgi:hypothetical protein
VSGMETAAEPRSGACSMLPSGAEERPHASSNRLSRRDPVDIGARCHGTRGAATAARVTGPIHRVFPSEGCCRHLRTMLKHLLVRPAIIAFVALVALWMGSTRLVSPRLGDGCAATLTVELSDRSLEGCLAVDLPTAAGFRRQLFHLDRSTGRQTVRDGLAQWTRGHTGRLRLSGPAKLVSAAAVPFVLGRASVLANLAVSGKTDLPPPLA